VWFLLLWCNSRILDDFVYPLIVEYKANDVSDPGMVLVALAPLSSKYLIVWIMAVGSIFTLPAAIAL